jgi:endonuclease YncB( thermonuclease family)
MHRLRLVLLALFAGAGLAAVPDAAHARTGTCLAPGVAASCTVWTGRVTFIGDGDTLYVDIDGDGTRGRRAVRITGINAMEQTVYSRYAARRRGECHAVEATARLEQLIRRSRGRVRLAAQDPASHSRNRLRRALAVRIGGRWRDVGRRLVSEGHALWLPSRGEWAWNKAYSTLAQRAAQQRLGVWNTGYCGVGPNETSPLQLWVNSDADGDDADNVGGEWLKIRNLDPALAVPLGGWWVRDSQLRRYTFPDYTNIGPGETITVYMGDGPNTWTEQFWGLRWPPFENSTNDERALGDGGYLFDPHGDLRTWMLYPCRLDCVDVNEGTIEITSKSRGREHILLRNISAQAVDLAPYRISAPPYSYAFRGDAVLLPGEQMQIDIVGDPEQDTRLLKSWGEVGPILRDRGDTVRLGTFTEIQIACHAFGDAAC